MAFRYYIYSIEFGNPPWYPYLETNNRDLAIEEAKTLGMISNVTVYVVDKEPLTMYQEIFVYTSSDFKRNYRRR